uniref:Photosystem II 22 kDa protein, chloroplastic n=1 Tax=Aegilops tauschii TaxID=37682 RepID=R7WDU9_AEGTA
MRIGRRRHPVHRNLSEGDAKDIGIGWKGLQEVDAVWRRGGVGGNETGQGRCNGTALKIDMWRVAVAASYPAGVLVEEHAGLASILGEAITGKGILSQLNLETGIPIYEAEPLLLFFILFTLLGAIGALGDRGRFVDEQPTTGLDKAVIAPGKGFRSALGLSEGGPLFGFTKSNELFVGRLAQLGIAFSIIGEIITGKGALAQLNIETGVPISEIEPLVLFNVVFFFIAAINPGTGKFISGEEDD